MQPGQVLTQYFQPTGCRYEYSGDHTEESGLAATGGTVQEHPLAAGHHQSGDVEYLRTAAICKAERLQAHRRRLFRHFDGGV